VASDRLRRTSIPARGNRVARVGVPAVMAALLSLGIGAAAPATSPQTATAEPAALVGGSAFGSREDQLDRASRGQMSRPALQTAPSDRPAIGAGAAEAHARKAAAAKQKAAQRKALAKKAAAKKAAAKKAAAKEKAAAAKARPAKAVATKFSTVALNVRTKAAASASVTTVLDRGSKVAVTSVKDGQWQQVVRKGKTGWVRGRYLSAKKPSLTNSSGGISSARCASGNAVESGLTADAVRVHRAICAQFPQIKSFGGVRADSLPEHPSGRALDAMVSDASLGRQIADWVRANRKQLGVSEIIYAQRIWTVQRGGEGWRSMSDRGSASANHYDHVHVTVYGSSGTA
jgi:uncharacterized protein YraI